MSVACATNRDLFLIQGLDPMPHDASPTTHRYLAFSGLSPTDLPFRPFPLCVVKSLGKIQGLAPLNSQVLDPHHLPCYPPSQHQQQSGASSKLTNFDSFFVHHQTIPTIIESDRGSLLPSLLSLSFGSSQFLPRLPVA